MILGIDTTNRERIELTLYQKDAERCFEFETKDQSADLLISIDQILKKEKISLEDLKAVIVNRGPGSFTGTRVGVTVANTLAWSLDIPIVGYRGREKDKILSKISKIPRGKFSRSALPYYEEF